MISRRHLLAAGLASTALGAEAAAPVPTLGLISPVDLMVRSA